MPMIKGTRVVEIQTFNMCIKLLDYLLEITPSVTLRSLHNRS